MTRTISTQAVINWIRTKLQGSAPASPAAGYMYLYPKTDKRLYIKDEDGTESKLAGGPATSTDNAVARFDGTGGHTLQNSSATVDDNGTVNIPTGQTYNINGSPHSHAGGGVSYANYYESTSHTVTDGTNTQVVEIDGERVDASGLASVASNAVTISAAGAGDYFISLVINVSASSPFNGHIAVYLNTTFTLTHEKKGYSTADAIQSDRFYLFAFSQNVNTDTIFVRIDNHSGFTVTYLVTGLTLIKLG